MPEESGAITPEERVGFAAGSRRSTVARAASGTRSQVASAKGVAAGSHPSSDTPSPVAPEPATSPQLEAPPAFTDAAAELHLLEDTVCKSVAPWMQLHERIQGLGATTTAGTPLASEIDALRQRFLAATTTQFKVVSFPDAVLATRQLVAAASAVFNGQPDAKAWPSRAGRVINANVVAADYEAIANSMREYSVKIASLDEAITNARD